LEGKKAFNQVLDLEAADTATRKPSRVWQTMAMTFWMSQHLLMERRDNQQLTCWHCGGTHHSHKDAVINWTKKKMTDTGCKMTDGWETSRSW
jgi:hypothetical protein